MISLVTFIGNFAFPPSSISMIGNTSAGLSSNTALPSKGFMPSATRHVGDGRHCENSKKESCSTDTRFTST